MKFKVPDWVKMGIPGEKFLGKDKEGWEYTSHDLWRKKMIWKPEYKKVWKTEKKQEWVRKQWKKNLIKYQSLSNVMKNMLRYLHLTFVIVCKEEKKTVNSSTADNQLYYQKNFKYKMHIDSFL